MAKLKGNVQFNGSLGDLVAYTREDVEGIIVQRKGGPTTAQLKKGENYQLTRKNNREFGGRSSCFSLLNNLVMHRENLQGYPIHKFRVTGSLQYAISSALCIFLPLNIKHGVFKLNVEKSKNKTRLAILITQG